MANVNGNHTTDVIMAAEAAKLGTAYGEGKDAWPMLFQKFASWGAEGAINSDTADKAKGTVDKVKARVDDFLKAAGKAQTLEQSTIANKETEMRAAVELGEYCAKVKVDPTKLITNVRDALKANREAKKPVKSMQTLNAFSFIARRFPEKKATKLWTTEDLKPLVKTAPTAVTAIDKKWQAASKSLALLTGLEKPKSASDKRQYAKTDTREDSIKVASAVVRYVNGLTSKPEPKSAAAKRSTPSKSSK